MGALHEGHLALIEEARARADHVVTSIFVNPIQFGANEDLDRYPRREASDAKLLSDRGCDVLWAPPVEEVYPPGFATNVSVGGVSEGLRSEEHTSELQSLMRISYAVFCLKKKK